MPTYAADVLPEASGRNLGNASQTWTAWLGASTDLAGVKLIVGTGAPTGVVEAPVGSLYLRTDGGTSTTLYVKETGTTTSSGWVAK